METDIVNSTADEDVVPVPDARKLEERIRELERLLGRKGEGIGDPEGGARSRTGKKTDLAVVIAATDSR